MNLEIEFVFLIKKSISLLILHFFIFSLFKEEYRCIEKIVQDQHQANSFFENKKNLMAQMLNHKIDGFVSMIVLIGVCAKWVSIGFSLLAIPLFVYVSIH